MRIFLRGVHRSGTRAQMDKVNAVTIHKGDGVRSRIKWHDQVEGNDININISKKRAKTLNIETAGKRIASNQIMSTWMLILLIFTFFFKHGVHPTRLGCTL